MFDDDTLIISYDDQRGEPRKRSADAEGNPPGDCVSCRLCVQVCPTGIDIRDGLQYECIGCAACIDACDEVMAKVGKPQGLIRYTTENAVNGKPQRVLRPRIYVYVALLLILFSALAIGLANRIPLELDIIRDRNALYRETDDGRVENIYTLRVLNMDTRDHVYVLSVEGPDGLAIEGEHRLRIPAGEVLSKALQLRVPPESLQATSTEIFLKVEAMGAPDLVQREAARFLGPIEY